MAMALEPKTCRGLPFSPHPHWVWHCVASVIGGKKTTRETWKACDEVTDEVTTAFCALASTPTISILDDYMGPPKEYTESLGPLKPFCSATLRSNKQLGICQLGSQAFLHPE
ncbi:hypothetical protein E2C01_042835 [Portunus trituberculatus]|uniref:Uncharacterized protein n=1 Tax=Portunus trituberculatus TaxID=210409 RepID=A0A5B7FUN2_PORTR|nr:hypothetical protein [Portunus trituberculatus]